MAAERRTLWIYPWDILESGIDEVVRQARDDWRLQALSLTASYHSAKFLLPRRTTEKVFLSGGSAAYFAPNPDLYAGTPLKPVVTHRTELLSVLDATVEACHRAGLELRAWTVALHNSRLGEAHPNATEANAFGDRYPWALCPSNPAVRAYAVALVRDVASHGVDWVDLESIGFHGLYHGHHHELIGIHYGPTEEFLLGLCFCEHCLDRAHAANIDGGPLRQQVADLLTSRFRQEATVPSAQAGDTSEVLSLLATWPELAAFVRVRLETVTTLCAEIQAQALAGGPTRLSPTIETFQRGAANAWLEGVDLRALAGVVDEQIVLAYFREPGAVAADLRFAGELAGGPEQLVAGMSLLQQGTTDAANLVAKVEAARALGVSKFSFYNYGFVSEERLRWLALL